MSVRKLKNTWWVDFYDADHIRHRIRSPENSRTGAAAFEAVLRQKLARGENLNRAAAKVTFAEAAEQWFTTYVTMNTRPSVQREYRGVLKNHLLPMFGSRKLRSITAFDLEGFKGACIKKGLSPKSTNNCIAVASRLFRDAHSWEWIDKVPKTGWLKVPPQPFDFLTPAESADLLATNRDSPWHDMMLCALRTGMRLGELLALRWESVDQRRRTITVSRNIVFGIEGSPKNNRVRHLPMTDDLWETLAQRTHDGQYVFGHSDGPSTHSKAAGGLARACRQAGLRQIGWHALLLHEGTYYAAQAQLCPLWPFC